MGFFGKAPTRKTKAYRKPSAQTRSTQPSASTASGSVRQTTDSVEKLVSQVLMNRCITEQYYDWLVAQASGRDDKRCIEILDDAIKDDSVMWIG